MYIVYRLNFSDGSKYIGQTSNLNNRLNQHKLVWKKLFDLSIENVDIVKLCNSQAEALAVEASVIENYGLENLRNNVISSKERIDETMIEELSDKLNKDEEPQTPLEVINTSDNLSLELRLKYLNKKVNQLENRYITTYYKYLTMKENIKHLDYIIDEHIAKEFK